MASNSANPFAWFGRMSKQNPKWAQDINSIGGMSGIDNANTTMGYMNAGQKALKGDVKGALTSGADTYLRAAVPAYGAIKTFNDITGGINFNRMMNPRKPVYDESKLASQAMNANMIESQRNLASQQMRDATELRQQIRPQYEKTQSDLLDMLTQGVSSRQLAPIYGAGESRNRAIGAASEAAMAQNLAARGVGGGIQAGVEQANLAAQSGRSADLNNAIVQQQLQQRPEMLNMAANLLANRDAQAAAELQAGQGMNLQASQMALNQMNLERNQKMQEDAIARGNRQQEMESIGSVLALLEPELQRMRTRGKKTPGQPDFMPTNTPSSEQIASEIMADEAKAAEFDKVWSGLGNALTNTPAGYGLPVTEETTPDMSFNLPFVSNVDTTGGLQQVTDFATIDEIMRSKTQSVTKDLGNGLTLIAYRDPETGRYVKTYRRSNAVPIQPMSDNSILRQSEVPMTQRTLGRAFYGA
jgi:hypothetical protein